MQRADRPGADPDSGGARGPVGCRCRTAGGGGPGAREVPRRSRSRSRPAAPRGLRRGSGTHRSRHERCRGSDRQAPPKSRASGERPGRGRSDTQRAGQGIGIGGAVSRPRAGPAARVGTGCPRRRDHRGGSMSLPLLRRRRRTAHPAGMFGPDAVEVRADGLSLGASLARSFAVVGYPREVGLGWLEPLLTHPDRLDVALHVEPTPGAVAADRLRRQLARLESGRRLDQSRGRIGDPEVETAAADAADLAARLARGEEKLFRVGLYFTVYADDREAIEAVSSRVRGLCQSLLLDPQPLTFRALQGWTTTLPLGA